MLPFKCYENIANLNLITYYKHNTCDMREANEYQDFINHLSVLH